jgi:hypothetical protein
MVDAGDGPLVSDLSQQVGNAHLRQRTYPGPVAHDLQAIHVTAGIGGVALGRQARGEHDRVDVVMLQWGTSMSEEAVTADESPFAVELVLGEPH